MTDVDAPVTVRDVYLWDHERLWRALYAFTGSRQLADETVAEVFTEALRHEGTIRDVTGWVWRSAFGSATAPATGPHTDATEQLAPVLARLDELDTADRRLLAWCHVGGWTAGEVAPALGMPRAVARFRLRRAEGRARTVLADGAATTPPAADLLRPFERVPVPDQWDEIVTRMELDGIVPGERRRTGRTWIALGAVAAVIAFVVGLIVTSSSTPDDDTRPVDSSAVPTATIGDGREVTLALNDRDGSSTAGTFRLRLYESGGTTLLEYEDVDVAPDDEIAFVAIELDGRVGSTTPYTPRSIGSLQLAEGTLTTPFTIRIVLTGADGDIVHSSDIVELTPDL